MDGNIEIVASCYFNFLFGISIFFISDPSSSKDRQRYWTKHYPATNFASVAGAYPMDRDLPAR